MFYVHWDFLIILCVLEVYIRIFSACRCFLYTSTKKQSPILLTSKAASLSKSLTMHVCVWQGASSAVIIGCRNACYSQEFDAVCSAHTPQIPHVCGGVCSTSAVLPWSCLSSGSVYFKTVTRISYQERNKNLQPPWMACNLC